MRKAVAEFGRYTRVVSTSKAVSKRSLPMEVAGDPARQQFVTFKVGAEEYGINVMQVREIIQLATIVRIPRTPEFVEGVFHLRDTVIPIIDLSKRFGLPSSQRTALSRILVVNVGETLAGLIVDAVCDVIRLPAEVIEPLPQIVAGEVKFLQGVAQLDDRLIILVDLSRIFSDDEIQHLQEIEQLEDEKSQMGTARENNAT